jgi:putative transcription factor
MIQNILKAETFYIDKMRRCEICGEETSNVKKSKVSGAELNLCPDCSENHGTVVQDDKEKSTDTKYSTSESKKRTNNNTTGNTTNNATNNKTRQIDALSLNYGQLVRSARTNKDMTIKQVSDKLNMKQSNLRKIEREDRKPTEETQKEIERFFDISLSRESDSTTNVDESDGINIQLGDVIERSDG